MTEYGSHGLVIARERPMTLVHHAFYVDLSNPSIIFGIQLAITKIKIY
jgi:hypothetical protein